MGKIIFTEKFTFCSWKGVPGFIFRSLSIKDLNMCFHTLDSDFVYLAQRRKTTSSKCGPGDLLSWDLLCKSKSFRNRSLCIDVDSPVTTARALGSVRQVSLLSCFRWQRIGSPSERRPTAYTRRTVEFCDDGEILAVPPRDPEVCPLVSSRWSGAGFFTSEKLDSSIEILYECLPKIRLDGLRQKTSEQNRLYFQKRVVSLHLLYFARFKSWP